MFVPISDSCSFSVLHAKRSEFVWTNSPINLDLRYLLPGPLSRYLLTLSNFLSSYTRRPRPLRVKRQVLSRSFGAVRAVTAFCMDCSEQALGWWDHGLEHHLKLTRWMRTRTYPQAFFECQLTDADANLITFSCGRGHASPKSSIAHRRWLQIVSCDFRRNRILFVFLHFIGNVFSDVKTHPKFLPCGPSPKMCDYCVYSWAVRRSSS